MNKQPTRSGEEYIEEFCRHLKATPQQHYDEKTIKQYKETVWGFWEFTGFADFKSFNVKFATAYRDSLGGNSLQTKQQKMQRVALFFEWFAESKLKKGRFDEALMYLKLNSLERLQIAVPISQEYPTLDEFNKIIDFPEENDEDRRDKALLCFLLLTAGRISAVCSANIGSFKLDTLDFTQNPAKGIKTKFSKYIDCTLFRFEPKCEKIICDWIRYLTDEKGFTSECPIFPKMIPQEENSAQYELSKEFYNSVNGISRIIKRRCNAAGVEYYSAHKFRHLAVDTAILLSKNGREIKAISQNIGHASLTTMLKHYANMRPDEYKDVIKTLVFKDYENRKVCDLTTEELSNILNERIKRNGKAF